MPIQGVGTTPFFNVAANGVVNSTAPGSQNDVHVELLSDGRFVFAWTTASDNIRARVFNADGTPSGADFAVETTTDGNQGDISLAALQDGHFVVAWNSTEVPGDGSSESIRARVFDADNPGTADPDFIVNTTTDSFQRAPAVALLTDGRFVVSWHSAEDTGPAGDFSIERARIFNADGSSAENDFIVNSALPGTQRGHEQSAITALGDGFLVTWLIQGEDPFPPTSPAKFRARLFDSNGDPVDDDFIINSTPTSLIGITPAVAVLDNGNFVVTWESTDYNPTDPNDPSTDDGNSEDGSATCIRARIFAPDGTPLGDDFIVNTTTEDFQREPSIVALADGRFVIAYTSLDDGDGGGGGDTCVRARIFDNDGTPSGDDFILNFVAQNQQFRPTLAALPDGRFVATWESSENLGGDGNGGTIRAQFFDPKIFNGTAAAETWRGGDMADTISGVGGNDNLRGQEGKDIIDGGNGNDRLFGDAGNDILTGGMQRDLLYGGAGRDIFNFDSIKETKRGSMRDKIQDLKRDQNDKIDLEDIDAKTGVSGNNKFKFIGKDDFSDTKGELRYEDKGSKVIVQGDVNGDGKADFEIFVAVGALGKGDFIL